MDSDNSVVDCWNQTIDEDTEEVLRDSINASEEIQHKQSPQPLKSVVEEEPNHSNMCEDEISKEGMCFDSCAETHAFYKNYASKALSLDAKCVIEDNDEAGIRPNKTYLALSNEVGGFSNLNFSEKDVRNYMSSKLRTSDMNLEVKEMLIE
ncbi:hypothetical protein PIB30_017191 [Stylosanthes scabra]|uniref:Uncharacterized protein n=1 Tax=Stylosanthes scabra TaxID=79078 RepID=A0ABU6X7S1_9FABA|nr:hypothetical protein [Stylosanthes scabra]